MNIENMTDKDKRCAIAFACGAKLWSVGISPGRMYLAMLDKSHLDGWIPATGKEKELWFEDSVPDYLNDLNAMASACATITEKVAQSDYAQRLIEVINTERHGEFRFMGASTFDQMNATARQRADAFLLTLPVHQPLEKAGESEKGGLTTTP